MDIEVINSQKFTGISDFIYSEVTTVEDFNIKNKKNNLTIIQEKTDEKVSLVWYVSNSISLKNSDIVFCQTELVEYFFNLISGNNQIKDLILISSQSDKEVDESLYKKKPDSIKKWFSVNVGHIAKDLIPIPLGVNNTYTNIFLHPEDFKDIKLRKLNEKEFAFYNNYNLNTKPYHRINAAWKLSRNKYSIFENSDLNKEEYLNSLNKYKYIICPWGNGYDSHRIWETIYSGSIAITQKTTAFKTFFNLPILIVNDFSDIKKIKTDTYEKNNFDLSKADFRYWRETICTEKKDKTVEIVEIDGENEIKRFFKDRSIVDKNTAIFKAKRRKKFKLLKFVLKLISNKKLKNFL